MKKKRLKLEQTTYLQHNILLDEILLMRSAAKNMFTSNLYC